MDDQTVKGGDVRPLHARMSIQVGAPASVYAWGEHDAIGSDLGWRVPMTVMAIGVGRNTCHNEL